MEFVSVAKRKRIDWYSIVCNNAYLSSGFRKWRKDKSRRIKSMNRLAYSYIRHTLGLDFIRYVRERVKLGDTCLYAGDLYRIAHTKWIVDPEEV